MLSSTSMFGPAGGAEAKEDDSKHIGEFDFDRVLNTCCDARRHMVLDDEEAARENIERICRTEDGELTERELFIKNQSRFVFTKNLTPLILLQLCWQEGIDLVNVITSRIFSSEFYFPMKHYGQLTYWDENWYFYFLPFGIQHFYDVSQITGQHVTTMDDILYRHFFGNFIYSGWSFDTIYLAFVYAAKKLFSEGFPRELPEIEKIREFACLIADVLKDIPIVTPHMVSKDCQKMLGNKNALLRNSIADTERRLPADSSCTVHFIDDSDGNVRATRSITEGTLSHRVKLVARQYHSTKQKNNTRFASPPVTYTFRPDREPIVGTGDTTTEVYVEPADWSSRQDLPEEMVSRLTLIAEYFAHIQAVHSSCESTSDGIVATLLGDYVNRQGSYLGRPLNEEVIAALGAVTDSNNNRETYDEIIRTMVGSDIYDAELVILMNFIADKLSYPKLITVMAQSFLRLTHEHHAEQSLKATMG